MKNIVELCFKKKNMIFNIYNLNYIYFYIYLKKIYIFRKYFENILINYFEYIKIILFKIILYNFYYKFEIIEIK